MSKRGWATIIYGRSYHLDFRFITIPDDFTEKDTDWALEHILASTQQARNLSDRPRWSLFKNDSHCVAGITCMVRDLTPYSSTDPRGAIAKDNQGRPLYTFVGYVTKLDGDLQLQNFPAYTEEDLNSFEILCHEIVKVWWVKNYERDSRQPLRSDYQPLEFSEITVSNPSPSKLPPLNNYSKSPDRTYLSPSSNLHNNLLWQASAKCIEPTSTCLNIKGKALVDSPFLNQTISHLIGFEVKKRIKTIEGGERLTSASTSPPLENQSQLNSTFSQKISHRAKEDLDLTLQQAAQVAIASQELIHTFADWSTQKRASSTERGETSSDSTKSETQPDLQTDEVKSFGFKTKTSSNEQDWF